MPIREIHGFGVTAGSDAAGESQERKAAIVDAVTADSRAETTPGGSALNSMRVAAWSGPGHVCTAFVGAVGEDKHAVLLRQAMAAVGVRPLLLEVPHLATARCAVLVDADTKDRFLAVARGAAGAMTPRFLSENPAVRASLAEAAVLYATAFTLSTPPRAACAVYMAEIAVARGAVFALNLSSAGLLSKVVKSVCALLPRCRFVFGNTGELRALARLCGWSAGRGSSTQGLVVLTQRLASQLGPGGVAVITDGARPTTVAQRRRQQEQEEAQDAAAAQLPVPAVGAGDVVDTNGCGDAFVGGFLCRAAQGVSLQQCVEEGHGATVADLISSGTRAATITKRSEYVREHVRFGHFGPRVMDAFLRRNGRVAPGQKLTPWHDTIKQCVACNNDYSTRAPARKQRHHVPARAFGELTTFDLKGPIQPPGPNCEKYQMLFVGSHTRWLTGVPLKTKPEVLDIIAKYYLPGQPQDRHFHR
eukprot:g7873.t1